MGWGSLSSGQRIEILIQFLGGPQYRAQVNQAALSTRRLGGATAATGLAMRTASRRTAIMSQALYTFRRYAFFGTVAALGLVAGLLKLGYTYLATRDSARAALSPIFKSTKAMNDELNYLFKLSKYSPFVLKDMTDALRVMYPSLHGAGMGVKGMNGLLLSMTNILSQSGRTTPAALNRISYAIQHMIYSGRLTGRLVQSLAAAGVNVPELLQRLGIAHANLSSISRLNISPQSVIKAITEMGQSGIFKGAAERIAMQSLPGMLQVLRDSLSQFMGIFLSGGYDRFKKQLGSLIGRGGLLDKLSNIKTNAGPQAALMALSTALTGTSGLGQGALLLAHIFGNIGNIFIHSVVPAFVIGLHALALFLPVLYPLNFALGILAHHATIVKWVLVPLAAWFVITHGAMLGMWAGGKLLNIMMFGNIAAIRKWIAILMVSEGRVATMASLTRLWTLATKGDILVRNASTGAIRRQTVGFTRLEKIVILTRARIVSLAVATWGLIASMWASATAAYAESGAIGVLVGALTILKWAIFSIPVVGWILLGISALALLIWKWRGFRDVVVEVLTTIGNFIYRWLIRPLERALGLFRHIPFIGGLLGRGAKVIASVATGGIIPAFQHGGISPGGPILVGEGGPEVINIPRGSSISPIKKNVQPIAALAGVSGGSNDRPIVVQLVVDRRILAEQVVRAQQDKEARR